MRDLKMPGEIFSQARLKTINALSGTEENTPYSIDENLLAAQKETDRQWFAKQELAMQKARKKLFSMRSKLKSIKEQNKERSRHRLQLMAERQKKETGKERTISETAQNSSNSSMFIEY
jgi:hypothetical protein